MCPIYMRIGSDKFVAVLKILVLESVAEACIG